MATGAVVFAAVLIGVGTLTAVALVAVGIPLLLFRRPRRRG